jgi:hypothetical protein
MRTLMTLGVLAAICAALAFASVSAAAQPVLKVIDVDKDVTDVQDDVNPCTGSPAVNTSVGRFTFHVLVFADGTLHVMMTTHGDLLIDSLDPAEADFTGHWTDAMTFDGTNGSAVGTFAFTPVVKGTDGSHAVSHFMGHTTVNANGDVAVDLARAGGRSDCKNT